MKRKFKIEVVVSALYGVLLCPIGEVYEILNFLTGDNLYTHQLPRAGQVCRIPVFKEHPFLKSIDVSGVNTGNWQEKVKELKAMCPEEIELTQIQNWTHIDPVEELETMVGKDKVIVVKPD